MCPSGTFRPGKTGLGGESASFLQQQDPQNAHGLPCSLGGAFRRHAHTQELLPHPTLRALALGLG